MTQQLLIATTNKGKRKEIFDLLKMLPLELLTPDDISLDMDVEENGTTYLANARLKARAFCRASQLPTLADRQRAVILADARRAAEAARGEGEAAATAIYAQALSQDPDFYEFVRTMDAYKKTMKDQTQFVLTPQSEFFKYLQ